MSPIRLGEALREPVEPPEEELAVEVPDSVFLALEAIVERLNVPAPQVLVEPPDLSAIVTAVTSLKPGVTAEEIAAAIQDTLGRAPDPTGPLNLVAEKLEGLDFRLQGLGRQAYGGGSVNLAPNQVLKLEKGTLSTVTSVASSTTSVTLLAENSLRHSVHLFNDSTSALFVKYGTAASSTSFTHKVVAAGSVDIVYPAYVGLITGIWTSVDGAARITEVTV